MKKYVRGILIHEGKILLMNITRNDCDGGYCVFVGGSVEEGEEPETAIIREFKEEADFDIKIDRKVYLETTGEQEHIYFLCDLLEGDQPHLGDYDEREIMAKGNLVFTPKWVSLNDLSGLRLLPSEIKTVVLEDVGDDFPEYREICVNADQEMTMAKESFSAFGLQHA